MQHSNTNVGNQNKEGTFSFLLRLLHYMTQMVMECVSILFTIYLVSRQTSVITIEFKKNLNGISFVQNPHLCVISMAT